MNAPEFDAVFFLMCLCIAFGAGWVLKGLCDAIVACLREAVNFLRRIGR